MIRNLTRPRLTVYRTFIAFDVQDPASFVAAMKKRGVNIGTCGISTVRLRPMLIFDETHGKNIYESFFKLLNPADSSQFLSSLTRSTLSWQLCEQ